MVVQEFEGLEAYVQACGRDVSLLGLSPGAASAYLGGVRLQHVCRAILEGRLDVVRVGIPDGSSRLYVPYRALWRYSLLPGIPFKSSPASRLHPFRSLLLESAPLIDSLRSVFGSGTS
jgi:hypothetical protein